LQLSLLPKEYPLQNALKLQDADRELALIEDNYLKVINKALFNRDQSCFHAASQKLVLRLLNALCKNEQGMLQSNMDEIPDWFYAGSTSLLLKLSSAQSHFNVILSPNWVYQQLPQQTVPASLDSLDEAVAQQQVKLNLELLPSKLSVKNLATMQVGDILTTNHPLNTPLNLTRNNELLAHADLGHSAQHKSIILKRSS
jgi:flagellar motor switch/type III secretory pathway protein FliN